MSPKRRSYSLLGIKTSPHTSPIGTPVIKYEPGSGLEDHNEHLSDRATPTTHCPGILLVPKSQPRHGNGDNDDSNDEDSMEPCDLRMDLAKALLAAAQVGGTATLPLGHHHHHQQQQQQQQHHHHHGRALTQLIYPAVPVQVPRPDTPTRRYSSSSGPGQDPTSSGGGGGGGAYACDRCGNTYARPHSLNRHVRFECGVEPKFECPICHKKSKHKHNLVLHMRTHQHR
ncbi:hypothetical protein M5D96_010269 [Drosophila gunungcola]|uniref:C2H2-type domain-containing protein n=1 Tax=Drosophila gunungcola TaxID=103775 RepID=A0A9P9YI04_9MUSC|nr:hypothetical protein M5D96_010269 [Drosophila gunungcola]